MKFIIAFAALGVLATAQAQFSRVELTKEDIIDIYAVPVQDQPAYKFEWKVASPTTFRLAIEFKRTGEDIWRVQQSSEKTADQSVYVTFISRRPPLRTADGRYLLRVRLGFNNKGGSGWGSFDVVLADIGENNSIEISFKDPENLVVIPTTAGVYRLRLQLVSPK